MAPWFPSDFLTHPGLGVRLGCTLEFRLTKRAAQSVSYALVFNDDMGLATIDTFAANRIGDHNDLPFSSNSIEPPRAQHAPVQLRSASRHALGRPPLQLGSLSFQYDRLHTCFVPLAGQRSAFA